MAYRHNPTASTPALTFYLQEFLSFTTQDISAIVGKRSVHVQFKIVCEYDTQNRPIEIALRTTGSTKDMALVSSRLKGENTADANNKSDGPMAMRLWCTTDDQGRIDIKGGNSLCAEWHVWVIGWLDIVPVDQLGTGDKVTTELTYGSGSYPADLSSLVTEDISYLLGILEQSCDDALTGCSSVSNLVTGPDGYLGNLVNGPMASAYYTGPAHVDSIADPLIDAGDGPGEIMVPIGASSSIRMKALFNNNFVCTRVLSYVRDYVVKRVNLVNTATAPSTWTTVDCKVDANSNPTGVEGRCLVYLRVKRDSYYAVNPYEVMTAVRNSDDEDNYQSDDREGVDTNKNGTQSGLLTPDLDTYVCIETNDNGEIQWKSSDNEAHNLALELDGYVLGPTKDYSSNPKGWVPLNEVVFDGTLIDDTPTLIDLSSYVGAQKVLVYLKILSTSGSLEWIDVKAYDDPHEYYYSGSAQRGCNTAGLYSGRCCAVIAMTDSQGRLTIKRSWTGDNQVTLLGYVDTFVSCSGLITEKICPNNVFVDFDFSELIDTSCIAFLRLRWTDLTTGQYGSVHARRKGETFLINGAIFADFSAGRCNMRGGGDYCSIIAVPVEPDGLFQLFSSGYVNSVEVELMGYIPIETAIRGSYIYSGATLSWEDLDVGEPQALAFMLYTIEPGVFNNGVLVMQRPNFATGSGDWWWQSGNSGGVNIPCSSSYSGQPAHNLSIIPTDENGLIEHRWRFDTDVSKVYLLGTVSPIVPKEFESPIELGTPPVAGQTDLSVSLSLGLIFPRGGTHILAYVNKAWHVPTEQWVRWITLEPDDVGLEYPGPGVFAECTGFRIEAVTYQPLG